MLLAGESEVLLLSCFDVMFLDDIVRVEEVSWLLPLKSLTLKSSSSPLSNKNLLSTLLLCKGVDKEYLAMIFP